MTALEEEKEMILGVAYKLVDIKTQDTVVHKAPFPVSHIRLLDNIEHNDKVGKRATDGFYTNKREFLDRNEAFVVADQAGQLTYPRFNRNRLYCKDIKGGY